MKKQAKVKADNDETRHCETSKGTPYTVEKWTCPICKEHKSTLLIDDEWCHGDAHASQFYLGEHKDGCSKCILAL